MAIFADNTPIILKEAYYGKKTEFNEIEKLLDVLIQKCHNISKGNDDIDINGSKELLKIEGLFEKAFGMEEMHITFYTISTQSIVVSVKDRSVMGANAYTYTNFMSYFKPKKDKTLTGDNLVCNVFIDINLVVSLKLTTGELMTIILHELGHCYNASFFAFLARIPIGYNNDEYKLDFGMTMNRMFGTVISDVYKSTTYIAELDRWINKLINSNKKVAMVFSNVVRILQNFFKMWNMRNPLIMTLIKSKGNLNFAYILWESLKPSNLFGYSDEKFADSFATAYGYGPESISVYHKMQLNKDLAIVNIGEKVPIFNFGIDLISVMNSITILPMDPHPDAAIRIQSQINKLKRDLKDPNLSPKVKKDLMDNLNEMENYVNSLTSTKENLHNGRIFTALYNKIMIKIFKGKLDIREIFEIVYKHEV